MLRYSLSFTGLLASLCYLLQWLICIMASWLTDLIRTRGILSTITIRRINTWIGLWITGACTALAGYAGCNGELTVALLVMSAGLNFFTVPGCKSGTLDIAPSYSGQISPCIVFFQAAFYKLSCREKEAVIFVYLEID